MKKNLKKAHKTLLLQIPEGQLVDYWTLGIELFHDVAQHDRAKTVVEELAEVGYLTYTPGRIRRTPTDPNGPKGMAYTLTPSGKAYRDRLLLG